MGAEVPTYSVFGLRLQSDVVLAEVDPISEPAFDCRLRQSADPAPAGLYEFMGEEPVTTGVQVRSFRNGHGYRLEYDDTGSFDLTANGTEITWWSGGRAADVSVQTDILGRVLAFALHMQGILTLHASGIGGQGVVFLAPKGFGKSTLAYTLVRRGALVISDDTVAVDLTSPPALRAGVQRLRLYPDVLRAAGKADDAARDKIQIRPESERLVGDARTPLHAIYLVRPRTAEFLSADVHRDRLSDSDSTLGVLAFRKLGHLLDGPQGAQVLAAAAELSARVPVYGLDIVRDLSRIEAAAQAVWSWHTGTQSDVVQPSITTTG
jgi:hypothetical protein